MPDFHKEAVATSARSSPVLSFPSTARRPLPSKGCRGARRRHLTEQTREMHAAMPLRQTPACSKDPMFRAVLTCTTRLCAGRLSSHISFEATGPSSLAGHSTAKIEASPPGRYLDSHRLPGRSPPCQKLRDQFDGLLRGAQPDAYWRLLRQRSSRSSDSDRCARRACRPPRRGSRPRSPLRTLRKNLPALPSRRAGCKAIPAWSPECAVAAEHRRPLVHQGVAGAHGGPISGISRPRWAASCKISASGASRFFWMSLLRAFNGET